MNQPFCNERAGQQRKQIAISELHDIDLYNSEGTNEISNQQTQDETSN